MKSMFHKYFLIKFIKMHCAGYLLVINKFKKKKTKNKKQKTCLYIYIYNVGIYIKYGKST